MLEPTHSRQTARVKTWDGKIGTAQAEDGGIYEINIETMDYAPVQVGDKIEIFWLDGKIESWRIAPKIEQIEALDYAKLSQMSGRQFFAQRSQILLRELYHFLSFILFSCILVMMLLWFKKNVGVDGKRQRNHCQPICRNQSTQRLFAMAGHRQRRNPQNPIFAPKLFAHHTQNPAA